MTALRPVSVPRRRRHAHEFEATITVYRNEPDPDPEADPGATIEVEHEVEVEGYVTVVRGDREDAGTYVEDLAEWATCSCHRINVHLDAREFARAEEALAEEAGRREA